MFGPSTLSICTNINISQDNVLETTENFLIQLNTEDQSVILNPSSVNVTIVDMNGEFHAWPILCIWNTTIMQSLCTFQESLWG